MRFVGWVVMNNHVAYLSTYLCANQDPSLNIPEHTYVRTHVNQTNSRRDLPRLLETVRRAMHQISEAAALAGLHHDEQHPSKPRGRRQWQQKGGRCPSEEEREVQARVRRWAAGAARWVVVRSVPFYG